MLSNTAKYELQGIRTAQFASGEISEQCYRHEMQKLGVVGNALDIECRLNAPSGKMKFESGLSDGW